LLESVFGRDTVSFKKFCFSATEKWFFFEEMNREERSRFECPLKIFFPLLLAALNTNTNRIAIKAIGEVVFKLNLFLLCIAVRQQK
jgi:hypothetical protein